MGKRQRRDVSPKGAVETRKPDGSAEDSFITRVARIKGRLAAVGALFAVILAAAHPVVDKGPELVKKVVASFRKPSPPKELCVVVNTPSIPPVKVSEWEETKFMLEGRNCEDRPGGVYVTFLRSKANGPRVRPPRYDREGCDRGEPITKTDCWSQKIPLAKGPWEIPVPLPPLERLTNPLPSEKISITMQVRDLQNPDKTPDWSYMATIEQRNDL